MRYGVLCAAIVVTLAGCAAIGSPPSPAFTPEAECWRGGGVWHPSMPHCEYNFSQRSGDAAG